MDQFNLVERCQEETGHQMEITQYSFDFVVVENLILALVFYLSITLTPFI
jgi:hypothetical protein